jgi:hypothetical protein
MQDSEKKTEKREKTGDMKPVKATKQFKHR